MAKKQSFGDKVRKQKEEARRMARVVLAEKKPNGQYRFRQKMVDMDEVQKELKAARG
ncbi:DUF4295 family protein [Rhodocaloribacter sp.]|jgi:hypothetical protein